MPRTTRKKKATKGPLFITQEARAEKPYLTQILSVKRTNGWIMLGAHHDEKFHAFAVKKRKFWKNVVSGLIEPSEVTKEYEYGRGTSKEEILRRYSRTDLPYYSHTLH